MASPEGDYARRLPESGYAPVGDTGGTRHNRYGKLDWPGGSLRPRGESTHSAESGARVAATRRLFSPFACGKKAAAPESSGIASWQQIFDGASSRPYLPGLSMPLPRGGIPFLAARVASPGPASVAEAAARAIVHPADLRAGRPQFRARRRRLAHHHDGRALPRFRRRRRGRLRRLLASASGQDPGGAGCQAVAHLQPLPHSRRRAAGRPIGGRDLRRGGVLLQFRRGGQRGRHQDGAQVSCGVRPAGAVPHHHGRGRLSRSHARDPRGRGSAEISGRVRAQGRGLRPGPVRRSRSAACRDRPGDGRHHDRADPGRGRHPLRSAAMPARAARALRRARAAIDL